MFLDIPPTLLDVLGLPPHPGFQGISLIGPAPRHDRSLYMIAQTPVVYETAIVRAGYKLLWAERSGSRFLGRYLLFNMVDDPGEQNDIAAVQPELVSDLAERLQGWRSEQLRYYADSARQSREYPPFFLE
jgi:arylsulfatase A-like enzyme